MYVLQEVQCVSQDHSAEELDELFSPSQKYQLLVYHADSLFHDKEYRNAVSKYTMALQQKKALSKTSKVRPSTGNSASTPQSQINMMLANLYKKAEKKSLLRDNVDLLGSLADLYFRAGDSKNSVLKFEQAQMLDPYLIKGAKAIQLNSNSVQALLLKGAALRNMGRVQEAIIHFREAIRLAPCRLDCYEGLIECYLASNSIREAMVMANNVYKTLGANAQTLTLLATVCLEDPVTQEKAKTLLDKALAQRPDYVKAVVKKAELLSECHTVFFVVVVTLVSGREQKYEDGIALLRNALANQSDCVLHRILGDFLVAVNEYQEAMDQYSIALSLDPNDQKSLEGMQKMEKEESPTDATQEEDVDDMEGSGEEGDLEGSDSEAAQWADQEQWFGMQ
ncbi:hypothetical protein A6R68_18499 [Neotoma lepida]|uniref:Anaphase-promoting complex subunit 7 n=1 Tax=Neotoma lepida TaxID=56216 RepID=A0A1A6HLC8_NEOLE|nr:hypothetical protein A6R68_18499 [Neotoma lepida]